MIKKKAKRELSPQQKEQRNQIKEIREIMKRIGFKHLSGIDGKEFVYDGRTSELDDIFVLENLIILTEYTIGEDGKHLLSKSILYNKINSNTVDFINFLINKNIYNNFTEEYNKIISKYTIKQLKLRIMYCSKRNISLEHKWNVQNVIYFDYYIVQYFKSLTRVIKRSARYEFLDFLEILESDFGDNILRSSIVKTDSFSAQILPEEKSTFKDGYKIVSFYIDADALLKRAYVLRQEGWRKRENVGNYQRMLDSNKISHMRKYLSEERRVFINNIISTLSENDIKLYSDYDRRNEISIDKNGNFKDVNNHTNITPAYIEIQNKCNIIGIIDGQHRTYAYHEGDDNYENNISQLRKIQNLLVTGIVFPKTESKENRLKFEANLFLEINSNQKKVGQRIQQEIQMETMPFSSIAIGKGILNMLNVHGPLENLVEMYTFETGKIKTASIVSFGLKPLIKVDKLKNDTLSFEYGRTKRKKT